MNVDHEAWIQTRGGGRKVVKLPWSSLNYSRVLDDTSSASASGSWGQVEATAREIGKIEAWRYELSIWAEAEEQWVGPIVEPSFQREGWSFQARDLTEWFERRSFPRDFLVENEDLANIFKQYVEMGLSRDDFGLTMETHPVGERGSRDNFELLKPRIGDELRELARNGVDYTMHGRHLRVGGKEVPNTKTIYLIDQVLTNPQYQELGLDMATEVTVIGDVGSSPGNPVRGTANSKSQIERYGLIEQTYDEPSILEDASAQLAAETRLEALRVPPVSISGEINPNAKLRLKDLVAGARTEVDMVIGYKRVEGTYRTQDVSISASAGVANVSLTLQSLGSVES